jgi:hypothetical protein
MKTQYSINSDISAELTDDDHLLTVSSQKHDDYDTYKIEDGEWVQNYDSLSNRCQEASEVWESKEFLEWVEKIKTAAKNA